jgi:hypothetical protein
VATQRYEALLEEKDNIYAFVGQDQARESQANLFLIGESRSALENSRVDIPSMNFKTSM